MVLGAARHSSVPGIYRRPLGYRPGYEHSVNLETKVIVVAARRMVLNDETRPVISFMALSPPPSTWLGAVAEAAFAPVVAQAHAKGIPARWTGKLLGPAPGELDALGGHPPGKVVVIAGQAVDGGHRAPHRELGDFRGQQSVAHGVQQLVDIGQPRR